MINPHKDRHTGVCVCVCVFSCHMPTHLSFVLFLLQDSVMVFIQQVNAHAHTRTHTGM